MFVYDYIYTLRFVNAVIYMNFREAVDSVCEPLAHSTIAEALGVSLQAVRQARMDENSKAFRAPPKHWRDIIIRLAERRIMHYRQLIEQIRNEAVPNEHTIIRKPDGRSRKIY
jgi:hypothetical protein